MQRFSTELRAEVAESTISGHASVFGQVARVGPHWEQIDHRAFDQVLSQRDTDVRAFVNHDHSKLLGRQGSGTLRLGVDERGLTFDVDLPDTSYAQDLRELMARGDLAGASFAFIPDKVSRSRAPDGRMLHTHTQLRSLVDVSVVTFPAYKDADVSLRSVNFEATPLVNEYRSKLINIRASQLKRKY